MGESVVPGQAIDPAAAMTRALELAEQGRGCVEPNPMVGAVVVREGRIAGEGWHERFGEAHAEVNAIAAAGGPAACRGATLYVTLEPCSHHGKTPPCADAVVAAGLAKVLVAMVDPFPASQGRGIERLRAAGIAVEVGLLEAEARRLNAPFIKLVTEGRPFLIAKWAMSLDGKIATRTGDSRWVSSPVSRRLVHEIRGRVDAVLVGISTALADDPLLTARPPGPRTATRIVADSRARLSPASQLVATARDVPLLLATTDAAPDARCNTLARAGVEILRLPANEQGRTDLRALLDELGRRRMTNVLMEGGGELFASALAAGLVDKLMVFVAPKLRGGRDAPSPVAGGGIARMADALEARDWSLRRLGVDALIQAWL